MILLYGQQNIMKLNIWIYTFCLVNLIEMFTMCGCNGLWVEHNPLGSTKHVDVCEVIWHNIKVIVFLSVHTDGMTKSFKLQWTCNLFREGFKLIYNHNGTYFLKNDEIFFKFGIDFTASMMQKFGYISLTEAATTPMIAMFLAARTTVVTDGKMRSNKLTSNGTG